MQIKKAAVLGAGVMGATIAAHLANAGLEVLLLDIVPRELDKAEQAKGLTLENPVEDEIPGVTHCDLRNASEFKPMISSFIVFLTAWSKSISTPWNACTNCACAVPI